MLLLPFRAILCRLNGDLNVILHALFNAFPLLPSARQVLIGGIWSATSVWFWELSKMTVPRSSTSKLDLRSTLAPGDGLAIIVEIEEFRTAESYLDLPLQASRTNVKSDPVGQLLFQERLQSNLERLPNSLEDTFGTYLTGLK